MWLELIKFSLARITEIEDGAWQAKERQMLVVEPIPSDPATWPGMSPDQVLAMCEMKRNLVQEVANAQVASETLTEAIRFPDRLSRAGEANLRAQQAIANTHRETLLSMARLCWGDHPDFRTAVQTTDYDLT